jgi:uncharacterized protein (TIGR02001 family)
LTIKHSFLAFAVLAATATPAFAAEDLWPMGSGESGGPGAFTGSVAVTSEYFFRGLSQTDDKPAVQGGLGYSYNFGSVTASAGFWGSNVNFADATLETDWSAGLSGTVLGATWTVGGIYYFYPGTDDSGAALDPNYGEITGGLGYDFGFMSAGVTLNYSPDFQFESGDGWYLNGNVKVPVFKYFDLIGSVGHQWIEKNANFGVRDYVDYKFGVATVLAGFNLEADWIGTDLPDSACATCNDSDRFIFTVSRTF